MIVRNIDFIGLQFVLFAGMVGSQVALVYCIVDESGEAISTKRRLVQWNFVNKGSLPLFKGKIESEGTFGDWKTFFQHCSTRLNELLEEEIVLEAEEPDFFDSSPQPEEVAKVTLSVAPSPVVEEQPEEEEEKESFIVPQEAHQKDPDAFKASIKGGWVKRVVSLKTANQLHDYKEKVSHLYDLACKVDDSENASEYQASMADMRSIQPGVLKGSGVQMRTTNHIDIMIACTLLEGWVQDELDTLPSKDIDPTPAIMPKAKEKAPSEPPKPPEMTQDMMQMFEQFQAFMAFKTANS